METSLLKRLVAKATLAFFIGSQLTGCLTVPNNNSGLTGVLQSAGQVASATQGSRSTSAQSINGLAQALGAIQGAQASQPAAGSRSVVQQTLGGVSPIGNPYYRPLSKSLNYSSAEFQSVYSRFKAAKSAMVANPRNFSQQQFYAFSGALADLMRYVDAIEARKEGVSVRGNSTKGNAAWASFYDEALAATTFNSESIEMGSAAVTAHLTSDRMVAWLSSEAPRANLPIPAGSGSNMPAQIQARPGQASESQIKMAVMEDLKDLAFREAFNQFTDENTALLSGLKQTFTSRAAQNIITAVPIVGNILNLGMLATGRNLDGSPMDGFDYAVAAIGVLPVAGNITSKFGQAGRILATELQGAAAYAKAKPQIEYGIELMGSEVAETAIESATPTMQTIYRNITSSAVNSMPKTAAYVKQSNVKI